LHENCSSPIQICSLPCRAGPRHRPGVRRPRAHAVTGPKKNFMEGVYIEIFDFWGIYIAKLIKRPENIDMMND